MRSPLALTDDQKIELRQCAGALPLDLRGPLLEQVAAHLQGHAADDDEAFHGALAFALGALPAHGDEHRELERCHEI